MATPAQAAAATAGAGSLAAAGAYGITQAVKSSGEENNSEQEELQNLTIPVPVTFENTQELGAPYTGKLIDLIKKDNLIYLVKTSDTKNKEWWKWAYENKYERRSPEQRLDNLFTNLESETKLKEACETAYTQNKDKYKFEESDYLLDNISSFCTSSQEKQDISEPKLISYANASITGYNNGLLSVETNKAKLVKNKLDSENEATNHNDLWWKWAFKNIYQKYSETKTAPFLNLSLGYKGEAETSNQTSLNNACNAAYKKVYSDLKPTGSTPNLLKQIKKFCSVSGESTVLDLPEPANAEKISSAATNYNDDKSLGKKTENQSLLVNPRQPTNQDWWEWVFADRYPKDNAEEKAKLHDLFKNLDKAYEAISNGNTETTTVLNKACDQAYKKSKDTLGGSDKEKLLIESVKKFCTSNTSTTTIAFPQ